MPTGTFFRLPEEKRSRLMEVAWEEFSNTPYAKVSINRIIQAAQIPRGSFYQYFVDKEDLFLYMVEDMQAMLRQRLAECISAVKGDLFELPVYAIDVLQDRRKDADPGVRRLAKVMCMNQGAETFQFLPKPERMLPEDVRDQVNTRELRRSDPEFLDNIFFFVVSAMCYALMEILRDPGSIDRQREELKAKMDLLRWGSCVNGPES